MRVCGIDPGNHGALAIVDTTTGQLVVCDMPTTVVRGKPKIDPHTMHQWLIDNGPIHHVVIEQVGGLPGMGATSAFTFGHGLGLIEGVLTASARRYTMVRPQQWTKHLMVSRDKGEHRQTAQRLHPDHAHLFARVKDDGRADAALIAQWFINTRTEET
jgi:crossover junction endodeoxyribonuclease RuvC